MELQNILHINNPRKDLKNSFVFELFHRHLSWDCEQVLGTKLV
jgi:hypothetical protein